MTDEPTSANPAPRHLTFHDVLVASGDDHDLARELALVALNEATGCSPRAAERLLDGPFGVGLGATVVSLMRVNEMALDAAVAEAMRRQLTLQHLRGGIEKALPIGVAEAFERIADYGFVQAVWPLVGQTEIVALCIAASVMIADEADVPGEAVIAFLRDPDTGYAFGAAIASHLMLDPDRRVERALQSTIRDWKKLDLPPAVAARFAATYRGSRLAALTRWHETKGAAED